MNYNRAMKIGPYQIANQLILAPMAGVTDRPFRSLCLRMGAGMAVSEMVTSNKQLWHTRKTRLRLDHRGEREPRSIQIAGTDPRQMAEAARTHVYEHFSMASTIEAHIELFKNLKNAESDSSSRS